MLRLLLLKEQGAVGGDVAGVAEAAAVVTVHKVGARLLLSLAMLRVINLLVDLSFSFLIASAIIYLLQEFRRRPGPHVEGYRA